MAKNLENETDPGETLRVEGQTETGSTPEASTDVKNGIGDLVSGAPEGEGVTESSEPADSEGSAEELLTSGAEDSEAGFDDLPEDIAIETNGRSEKIGSFWEPKKVIAGLVLGFCVSPLMAYGLKHWQTEKEEKSQEIPSTQIYRASVVSDWSAILDLAAFIVLLPEKADRAYFSLGISLRLSNRPVCREIEGKKTFFRGAIYRVLKNAGKDTSLQAISKEELKRDIVSTLNGLLQTGTIDDIYFTDFLVV